MDEDGPPVLGCCCCFLFHPSPACLTATRGAKVDSNAGDPPRPTRLPVRRSETGPDTTPGSQADWNFLRCLDAVAGRAGSVMFDRSPHVSPAVNGAGRM